MASKVRINLANEQELLELPGLDSAQAAAIVRFRSQHGPDGTSCYVPSSQEARYFACSSVSSSIAMPMVASFRRAISLSISSGTG